jgi:hypothetical protein
MSKEYLNIPGSFECVVENPGEAGWFGETKEQKTPFLRLPLKITEGPQKGKICVYNAWLTEAAFDRTIQRLKQVFGFNGDLNALYEGKASFAGMPCNIEAETETYQGKARVKIAWLNPPGGSTGTGPKPMEANKLSSLLSKLGPRAKAIAKATQSETAAPHVQDSTRTTSSGNTVTQEVNDDDVPF